MEELFKSLSESVSEECYSDILNIVEEIINERDVFTRPRAAKNSIPGRKESFRVASSKFLDTVSKDMKNKGVGYYDVETEHGKPVYVHKDYEDDKINTWKEQPSSEVHDAYNKMKRARRRLSNAEYVAGGTVGQAFDHEDEHQKKVQAAKESNNSQRR